MILGKETATPITMPSPKCGKCGADMQDGFVPDTTYGGLCVPFWMAGKPERGFFGNIKTEAKERRPIRSFRCVKCGYLESYALGSP